MTDLRTLVVDDEPPAVRRLCRSLEAIDGIDVIGTTSKATEAVKLIEQLSPDLLFIDVAMPRLSGLQVADRVARGKMAIVFVTGHHEHAAAAFDIDAADYLLKPVSQPRLEEAVIRSRRWLDRTGRVPIADGERVEPKFVWAYTNREFVRIWVDQIEWIEAQGNYVWVHAGDQGGMMRTTITALLEWLDPLQFIRVHRSVICRIDAIDAISRRPSGAIQLRLKTGTVAPVGRTYVADLNKVLALTT